MGDRVMFSASSLSFALAGAPMAQDRPDAGFNALVAEAINKLPGDIAGKIAAARTAAKAAIAEIEAMKTAGMTRDEIVAMVEEKRAAALMSLQKALDAFGDVPDMVKIRTAQAGDMLAAQLEERKSHVSP